MRGQERIWSELGEVVGWTIFHSEQCYEIQGLYVITECWIIDINERKSPNPEKILNDRSSRL